MNRISFPLEPGMQTDSVADLSREVIEKCARMHF